MTYNLFVLKLSNESTCMSKTLNAPNALAGLWSKAKGEAGNYEITCYDVSRMTRF